MKTLKQNLLPLLFVIGMAVFSCEEPEENTNTSVVKGCMDTAALNYNALATEGDGSCDYYKSSESDTSTGNASSSANMTEEDLAIYNMTTYEGSDKIGKRPADSIPVPQCATISLNDTTPLSFPKIVTIDFGTTNCVGYDGKSRRGKLHATFTNRWLARQTGDSIIVDLDNYYVNDTMVTGIRYFIVTATSQLNGNVDLDYLARNASVVYPSGDSATWQSSGTLNVTGLNTPLNYTDDTYTLAVAGTGTNTEGQAFDFATQSGNSLYGTGSCVDACGFVKGILDVSSSSTKDTTIYTIALKIKTTATISISYGDGTCDGTIDVTTKLKVEETTTSTIYLDETYGPDNYACGNFE